MVLLHIILDGIIIFFIIYNFKFLIYIIIDIFFSNIFSDNCMIHDRQECLQNQVCSWDSQRSVCVDYNPSIPDDPEQSHGQACSDPYSLNANYGTLTNSLPNKCKRWVNQPAGILFFDSESQSMFYHW